MNLQTFTKKYRWALAGGAFLVVAAIAAGVVVFSRNSPPQASVPTQRMGRGAAAIAKAARASARSLASSTENAAGSDPGALITMEMNSTVGVVLDDIPEGSLREAAAAEALQKGSDFWLKRAKHQIRLTYYRLVFRGLYYSSDWSANKNIKGPLPLPNERVWNVTLNSAPRRERMGNQDIVHVDYTFNTYLLSDAVSPGVTEPNLAMIGGTWSEGFNLPIDPEQLLQRTGYACMDEEEYPRGSVFEQNTWYFYDDTCKANSSWCHLTAQPTESCVEALQKHSGIEKTSMNFTRVPYSAEIAGQMRVGTITHPTGADLAVVPEAIEEEHAIRYQYFAPGSCELEEGVIGKLGWRRLLTFSAVVQNNGRAAVHIGKVSDPANPWRTSNVFEFSACHQHYHFSHYGTFGYNRAPGSKRAFCLEDTNRFHNDETTPLTAEHQSCDYQGIGAGWGDEYEFGIPGQWVDITDVDAIKPHDLTFQSNPDEFLCEGTPVLDANGIPIFDPTEFRDSSGNVVSRIRCDKPEDWNVNNLGALSLSSPGGSFVTEPCRNGENGPLRDCGFKALPKLRSCAPGSTVNLRCTVGGPAQIVRVCEKSAALGTGVACTMSDSLANAVDTGSANVSFVCPAVRDSGTGAGGYSLYSAPVLSSADSANVTCN